MTFANPATHNILESLRMDKGNVELFLPADLREILEGLKTEAESIFHREVSIKDRVFGETVYLSLSSMRYAFMVMILPSARGTKSR